MKTLSLTFGVGLAGVAACVLAASLFGPTVGAAEGQRELALGPLVLLEVERTEAADGTVDWTRSVPPSTLALAFALPAALTYLIRRSSRSERPGNPSKELVSQ